MGLKFGVLPALVCLVGCAAPPRAPGLDRFEYTSPHMGTRFRIALYAESRARAELAAQAAFSRVAELEDVLSDYMADSELMELSRSPAGVPVPLSADLFDALERGRQISALTDGAFDVTAGPLTRLWRFSRKRGTLPGTGELEAARAAVGWRQMVLDPEARTATLLRAGMRLDAGGIGKGYAADEAMKVLRAHGVDRALIAAGGDVLAGRPPPGKAGWLVAIRGPDMADSGRQISGTSGVGLPGVGTADPGRSPPQQTVLVRHGAVSTSGDAEQFVEIDGVRYSHIMSPFTGLGLTNRIQATVMARDAATSDALATACCVLGPDRALGRIESLPGVSALLLVAEGEQVRVVRSRGWP